MFDLLLNIKLFAAFRLGTLSVFGRLKIHDMEKKGKLLQSEIYLKYSGISFQDRKR